MKEIWKDVKGYDGIYQVSNLGRVKSLERGVQYIGSNGKSCWRINRERILKSPIASHGYPNIGLRFEGNVKVVCVHRLVADAFLPNPDNKETVNHKNGDKTNNNVNNLEWATNAENLQHAIDKKLRVINRPVIGTIGNTSYVFRNAQEASKELGYERGAVGKAISGGYRIAGMYWSRL